MKAEDSDGSSSSDPSISQRIGDLVEHGRRKVKSFDAKRAWGAVKLAPEQFKRDWQRYGATGVITKFPIATVVVFLMLTCFFAYHSGFVDGTSLKPGDEPSLNVNGDLEVYLPDGSRVSDAIKEVEKDWSTNVMIIYVESSDYNITDRPLLNEMHLVESTLNPYLSDRSDDVIYVLSLSTVVKEVNSSAPRVLHAFISELGEEGCLQGSEDDCITADVAEGLNEQLYEYNDTLGGYAIPTQPTINLIVQEMYDDNGQPTPGLDKLARDTDGDEVLDRAVIIVAVDEKKSAKEIISATTAELERLSEERGWDSMGLEMTLTGPVPITNAVTEFSFKLFWEIFPIAVVLVALGLFIFHSDVLQTGSWRPLQGFKVVVISGLPTLCAVFWTLGIIGWLGYEVTMTVIIVGPILLALGVSYGLHITNRYAEETGTKDEKMRGALSSTGKAVFLSAVTTVIGFISLTFTPMKPIATVGLALSGGIVVVYILTMFMVPNLTLILDLKKPKHPPLKVFDASVSVPIKWPSAVIAVFMAAIFISAYWGQDNVEENIDLLGMAPEGEPSVVKMKQYSKEFEAGQVGMVLVHGNVSGDKDDDDPYNDDPFGNLEEIDKLETNLNTVKYTTAVSIVFLMKSAAFNVNITGTPVWELIDSIPGIPDNAKDPLRILFDREVSQGASFWDVLKAPDQYGFNAWDTERAQIFLLDVFYRSLTDETRELFVSTDYKRSLIYIDMPFLPVAETTDSVERVNEYSSQSDGGIHSESLTGVAAVAIAVNELIVASQWSSLGFAVILTILTLAIVFRDLRYAFWTTSPVIATVALQWLVMWQMDVSLSLVTVMIGSILVGVGVDFSIHIANRIKEMGGGIKAIREATVSTGMSLFEAATVTTLGMITAYKIPIPEIKPFISVIIILLWIAAASALVLLPAIFVALEKSGVGAFGGTSAMAKRLGLGMNTPVHSEQLDEVSLESSGGEDAW